MHSESGKMLRCFPSNYISIDIFYSSIKVQKSKTAYNSNRKLHFISVSVTSCFRVSAVADMSER